MSFLKKFAANEKGAAAIEYSLIVSMIALAIIPVLTQLGERLSDTFAIIATTLSGANQGY